MSLEGCPPARQATPVFSWRLCAVSLSAYGPKAPSPCRCAAPSGHSTLAGSCLAARPSSGHLGFCEAQYSLKQRACRRADGAELSARSPAALEERLRGLGRGGKSLWGSGNCAESTVGRKPAILLQIRASGCQRAGLCRGGGGGTGFLGKARGPQDPTGGRGGSHPPAPPLGPSLQPSLGSSAC